MTIKASYLGSKVFMLQYKLSSQRALEVIAKHFIITNSFSWVKDNNCFLGVWEMLFRYNGMNW